MISEQEISSFVKQFNGDRGKTFAEFIAELFKDKFIEIYLGDSYEEISLDQVSTSYPTVFCGKVVSAFKECLIINSYFIENKKVKSGNMVFINERSIRALSEIDGNGILEDMFVRSKETLDIKSLLKNKSSGK